MKITIKRWRDALRNILRRKKGSSEASSKNLAINQVLRARHAGAVPRPSQLKYLPRLLNKNEKKIALGALIIVIIASTFLAGRFINEQRALAPAVGGTYTEGLIGAPQLINPLYAATSDVDSDLTRLMYSGLMRYDSVDGLVTDLAENYEISEDNLTYTFKIRDNAKWHDGRPVIADDVIFTINALQNPEYRSPLEISFSGIVVEQVDERTIRFVLEEPFAPFLSLLTVGILPSHIWQEIAPLNAPVTEYNKKPVGSGPYEFEKFSKDSKGNIRSYTLKRNADYYLGSPYIEELVLKFYPETTSAIEALRNHNIEGLSYLPLEVVADFERDSSTQIIYPTLGQYVAAFFNEEKQSILKTDAVREALALGSDKQKIIDSVLDGHGEPVKSFILPGMIGDYPELNVQVYDPPSAREKLDNAGWTLEEGAKIRTKDGNELVLELVTLQTMELTSVATELAEQWEEIGIRINVRLVEPAEFQSDTLKNRNYDILLSGELYGIDPDPYAFWHSSQTQYPGLNLSGFSNRKADQLIETARESSDVEKREEALRELQELVADEITAVFLYQPYYSYAVSSKINGIEILHIVNPSDRFSRIHEWFIKTRRTL
ncbi:MAG: ABC transporter substrate-binding protein [Patescibacteria group bacterium]